MYLSRTIFIAVTTLVASTAAYYNYDSGYNGLQARGYDDLDDSLLSERDAEDELINDLASRDLDEMTELFVRALEIRGTDKRPGLQGNLRITPQWMAEANGGGHQQQIPASINNPSPPRNGGGTYFPKPGQHQGGQRPSSRRGSDSSMRSLFGSP